MISEAGETAKSVFTIFCWTLMTCFLASLCLCLSVSSLPSTHTPSLPIFDSFLILPESNNRFQDTHKHDSIMAIKFHRILTVRIKRSLFHREFDRSYCYAFKQTIHFKKRKRAKKRKQKKLPVLLEDISSFSFFFFKLARFIGEL